MVSPAQLCPGDARRNFVDGTHPSMNRVSSQRAASCSQGDWVPIVSRIVRPELFYDALELYKRKRRDASELKSCWCGLGIEFGLRPVPSDGVGLILARQWRRYQAKRLGTGG